MTSWTNWDNLDVGNDSSFFDKFSPLHEPSENVLPAPPRPVPASEVMAVATQPHSQPTVPTRGRTMHNENRAPKLVRSKSVPIRSRPQEPPKKTVPVTPNVLKRSARLTTRRSERPVSQEKFKARPAQVLQRKPFCPAKLPKAAPTQVQPFNLLSENRLKERQEYNKRAATKTEAKLEKSRQEEAIVLRHLNAQARKLTQFKARPNPFK